MTGSDPTRDSESSEFSDSSDIVGTPGVVPFTWEEQPGRPKGPGEAIFESVLTTASNSSMSSVREPTVISSRDHQPGPPGGIVHQVALETSSASSDDDGPSARIMSLNLRASLMGVHILDDETEMFFSRQVSNASNNTNTNTNPNGTPFRSSTTGATPFKWEMEPGKPFDPAPRPEPLRVGPLIPPPGSRPTSGILYPGQFNLGPESATQQYASAGTPMSEKIFKKLAGQSRMVGNTTTTLQVDGVKIMRKRGSSSTETLDRHFGHYGYDLKYETESVSPTSTLDHNDSESSPSSSERYYPSRHHRNFKVGVGACNTPVTTTRPSSQLAQCLLSLTAMADDTTDEDDIIFEQPSTTAPIMWQPQEHPGEPLHGDWPIVQYAKPTKPTHRRAKNTNSPTRTHERWSSNSSSWNLSLLQKPGKVAVTNVVARSTTKQPKGQSSRHHIYHGTILREVPSTSGAAVLTYDRSGDVYGRHRWERDSSGSLPSVDELGFEAYDRPEEVFLYIFNIFDLILHIRVCSKETW